MSKPNEIQLQVLDSKAEEATSKPSRQSQRDPNDPNYKTPSQRSGWVAFSLFLFELPTVITAYRLKKRGQTLDEKTLPGLAKKDRSEILEKNILKHYEEAKRKNPHKTPNLSMAVIKATKWDVIICHVLETAFLFLRVFGAFGIKKLLDAVTYDDIEIYNAYIWAAVIGVSQMLSIYVEHHMYQLKCALPLYVRGALMSLVYSKINRLSVYTIGKISPGKLVNIVANDLNVFERSGLFFTHVITGIAGLIAGTTLIWIFFNVTVLLGIGFLLATLPISHFITRFSIKPRTKLNTVTDERVKLTSEMFEGIRLLKMYTWELIFRDNIDQVRQKELKLLKQIRNNESISRSIAYSTHALTTFLIYMLYTLTGGTLRAPEVFATHFLFTFMRKFSAIFVAQGVVFLAEANLLMKRLGEILDSPEIGEITFKAPENDENAIEFEGFSASWFKEENDNSPLKTLEENKNQETRNLIQENKNIAQENRQTLVDINMKIKKGSHSALVGKVGSGKSSFLLSFTGEMSKMVGSLRYNGTIAYVEQEPTIFAGTLRESILFGKEYKPEFYHRIIEGCNLESDFKLFAQGDLSEAGERGNNLSGGQKARLALARAIYADCDIYLLDDPLSAVDAKVAKSLYNHAIKGLLKDKTVILVTHQVHFVKDLENIMVIEEGKIVANGSYKELKEGYSDFEKVFPSDHQKEEERENIKPQQQVQRKESTIEMVKHAREEEDSIDPEDNEVKKIQETPKPLGEAGAQLIQPENSESGKITLKTYGRYYGQTGNIVAVILMFCIFVITQFANIAYGRILAAWTTGEFDRNTSLAAAGGITGFILCIYMFQNYVYNYMTIEASRKYHIKMLDKIVKNPISFFDKNPLGRILNRFSNDIGALDISLPASAIDAIDENAIIFSLVLATIIIKPWTALPIGAAVIVIVFLIKICYPAIEQTRNYELISRSPLFSQFSSTLSGIIVIRSYKQTDIIKKKFQTYLNNNTRGSVGYTTASRFFAIYVDVFYTFAAIGNSYIVIAMGGDPGLSGFALMLIVSVTGAIQFALRQLLQAHILMASASRVQSYCDTKTEAALALSEDERIQKTGWPQKGEIDFNRVYMKYRPELDYVLRDLTLHAKAGEKVGCIGRTGAGKSTIIQILFRMVEIDKSGDHSNSSFVKVDEVDTQSMGLHLLRNNISIIPQIPFCFTGTVKKNLDPIESYSEDELWKVLEDVNLKGYVESLEKGLHTDMTNASSIFSVGQKQLICLARTILKRSKILVLDEATANVDFHTDNFIQQKISEKFNECTVFTIAHRLTTIANYDKVLVLDKGMKMEYDHPYRLLVKTIGDSAITNVDGHFASMVLNTGPKTSQEILRIAKQTFEEKGYVQ